MMHHPIIAISSTETHTPRYQYAQALSQQLDIPMVAINNQDYPFLLVTTSSHLELHTLHQPQIKPIWIDFLNHKLSHRRLFSGGHGQLMARAIGTKKIKNARVLDLTAGLGVDGFMLANLACQVTMIERHPIIAALLRDALIRAQQAPWFCALQLTLVESTAQAYLATLTDTPDVIYLDPMYPEHKRTTQAKKEMQLLRQLVGKDEDAPALLKLALQKVRRRVVVKRPRLAPSLLGPKPHHQYIGKSSRFDVYFTNTTIPLTRCEPCT